jgi:hypothetical protein
MTHLQRRRDDARRTFLRVFPDGFVDETYLAWERDYKTDAHRKWVHEIGGKAAMRGTLDAGGHHDIAMAAARIEAPRPLLFSFEKMALRDAVVRSETGGHDFAEGLYDWLYGPGSERARFERWADVLRGLPRRQTRVATWPLATVFGFIARPKVHVFLNPLTTKRAAAAYDFPLHYRSLVDWSTYGSVLEFAHTVRDDIDDLGPRDMIDVQSFIWVIGSDEYADHRAA